MGCKATETCVLMKWLLCASIYILLFGVLISNKLYLLAFFFIFEFFYGLYYIQSHEIQEYIDEIKCIFYIFTSENIKLYIFTLQECTYNFFGLPLTFPLTYCSALQNFKRL